MKLLDWLSFAVYAIAGLANLGSFLVGRDFDNLMIAALFVVVGIWHYSSIRAGRLIDNYANLVDQLTTELEKWTPIARHEATFADMPKISSRPLPVPEGHPEFGGDTL